MNWRPLVLLAAAGVSMSVVVLGPAGLVEARLPGGLPLGTLLAAVALVAGAAVPLAASRPGTVLRWVGAAGLGAAAAWLPLGIVLSGNAALNFVDDAADSALFWTLTRWLAGLILATMGWAGVTAALRRRGAPT